MTKDKVSFSLFGQMRRTQGEVDWLRYSGMAVSISDGGAVISLVREGNPFYRKWDVSEFAGRRIWGEIEARLGRATYTCETAPLTDGDVCGIPVTLPGGEGAVWTFPTQEVGRWEAWLAESIG